MEPEVHIVEKWLQLVHKCFTATNVRADGNKEIDILGINPRKNAVFHIECNCKVGHRLTPYKKFSHKAKEYPDELNYFSNEKFSNPMVLNRIREYIGNRSYQKTLVVWGIYSTDGGDYENLNSYSVKNYGFTVRLLSEIIYELKETVKAEARGHRDDILRLIELGIVQDEEVEKAQKWFTKMAKIPKDLSKGSGTPLPH